MLELMADRELTEEEQAAMAKAQAKESDGSVVTAVSGETMEALEKPPSKPWTPQAERQRKKLKEEIKPWPLSTLKNFEATNSVWARSVPNGTTQEEILDPLRWKNVADFLCPGDILYVHTADWRKRWECLVLSGARFGPAPVKLHIKAEYDLPKVEPGEFGGWDNEYRIEFEPDRGRWQAYRRSDGAKMCGDGVGSRAEVEASLRSHPTNRLT